MSLREELLRETEMPRVTVWRGTALRMPNNLPMKSSKNVEVMTKRTGCFGVGGWGMKVVELLTWMGVLLNAAFVVRLDLGFKFIFDVEGSRN